MKKLAKWSIGGTCCFLIVLVIAPVLAYYILSGFVLTPDKLKALLETEVLRYLKGNFNCQSVELIYWETWPFAGISVTGGSYLGPETTIDSISSTKSKLRLSFNKLVVFVNALDYLKKREISVREISIVHPKIYIRSGDGQPLDLWAKKAEDSVTKTDSLFGNLHFDIQKFSLYDGYFVSEDIKNKQVLEWEGIQLTLGGKFSRQDSRISLFLKSDSFAFVSPNYSLNKGLPVTIKSEFVANVDEREIDVRSAHVRIRDIPFEVQGRGLFESPQQTWVDASFSLSVTDLKELLNYIPSVYLPDSHRYEIEGKTSLTGTLKGYIGKGIYPDLKINGKLAEGSFFKKGMGAGIDAIGMDFSFIYPSACPDSSVAEINNLTMSGLDCYVNGKARINNVLRNPFVDLELKSDIDFNRLGAELFDPDTIELSGDMKLDLSLVFNWDDLCKGRYNRVWADGALDINQLKMSSDVYDLRALALNTHASIGYKQNQSHFIRQREVLGGTLHVDTFHLHWGQQAQVAISNLNVTSNTGLQQDPAAITPLTTHLKIQRLQSRVLNDVAVLSSNMELHAGIKPSDKDKRMVAMAMVFTSDTLEYLDIVNQQAAILSSSQFISEFHPKNDTKLSLDINSRKLFEQWDMKGYLIFDHLRTFSRRFPVQIRMHGTKLGFMNNRLILNNAEIQVGKSDALVSGEIVTSKLDGKKQRYIAGNLSIQSKYIDFNELRQALLQGEKLEVKEERSNSTVSLLNLKDLDQSLKDSEIHREPMDELTSQMIYVPDNLDLSLSLDLKDLDLYDFNMQEMRGTVTLKENKASCDFSTHTNMGDTHMGLLYKTPTSKKADIYLDWDLNRIQVGKLRKMFPTIETLFPMLNSIDGILDCKLITYCPIDSAMNVDLKSVYAACALHGKDMVLFSNESFRQIADKLRFKDKKNNPIDEISVEFIAKDQLIDIFPFALDMDRYQFIVGGKHSMDMSFDYHIDVLKSPIPFNFGLNINGMIGDFKYKLGKTKYTSIYKKPMEYEVFRMSKQRKMDEVRAEIRAGMRK